jgi:lipopolysaccharide transport system permease protein
MNELWKYRELIWNLTQVNLKVRYQNTSLGFLWSILSPLLLALVLFFVFRYMYHQEVNFAAYLLVGLMSWRFFSVSTTSAVYSVVGKASLVTKVYIPREILVLSNSLANLISSLLEFIIIIPLLFIVTGHLLLTIFLFPLVFLVYFWFAYGVSLCLGAFYVYYRDINQIWEVLVSTLFFLSPVVYPMVSISDKVTPFYLLNPLTAFIVIFRDLMIYGALPSAYNIIVAVFFTVAAFFFGRFIFQRLQRRFAEEI